MSTVDAILRLVDFIYDSLNGKSYTLCVFVDISKAFDTVNHEILMHKLFLYGIRGKFFSLIERYLHNRVQRVRLALFFLMLGISILECPRVLSWVLSYFCMGLEANFSP